MHSDAKASLLEGHFAKKSKINFKTLLCKVTHKLMFIIKRQTSATFCHGLESVLIGFKFPYLFSALVLKLPIAWLLIFSVFLHFFVQCNSRSIKAAHTIFVHTFYCLVPALITTTSPRFTTLTDTQRDATVQEWCFPNV